MKKLFAKDKKLRSQFSEIEKKYLILKSIYKNSNFFTLVRWNAYLKLNLLSTTNNKIKFSNRCVATINKKRFNKTTNFSRHVLLKLIRFGKISGMKKSSW